MQLSCELRWLLGRAFGPVAGRPEAGDGFDREATLELARRFALGPRLGVRIDDEVLGVELGESGLAAVTRERAGAVAGELQRDAAVAVLRRLSARLELPIVLLKGVALRLAGVTAPGARFVSDTDVLVPEARRWELQRALEEEGFEALDIAESELHLPVIARRKEGPIEVHRRLLGVRLEGSRRSVGFDDLATASLLELLAGEGTCYVPTREVLAAHALVHGFVQHGAHPEAYPQAVVLADLIDLGLGRSEHLGVGAARGSAATGLETSVPGEGSADPARDLDREVVACLVARELDAGAVAAVAELCRRLEGGEYVERRGLEAGGDGSADAPDRLLSHVLAGCLDEGYRNRLKLAWFGPRLSDRSRLAQLAHMMGTSLFPDRARLEVMYGATDGALARLGLRVRHVGRLAVSLGRAVSPRRP